MLASGGQEHTGRMDEVCGGRGGWMGYRCREGEMMRGTVLGLVEATPRTKSPDLITQ